MTLVSFSVKHCFELAPYCKRWSLTEVKDCCLSAGIHLVTRNGPRITYLVYNLSTGKLDQESLSPTDATAFVGRSDKHIQLHNGGEVSGWG